uniref:Uncharacterized protein n=1 Tax=Picea glauca TaxID=3330 RepID=A0A101M4W6_PICGL|nr:hypothetical protein ABT39_MTgene874 [Picea glauca]QHR89367.1 hypothetical protein Q903MT_gene3388 [Picea sitchensis]
MDFTILSHLFGLPNLIFYHSIFYIETMDYYMVHTPPHVVYPLCCPSPRLLNHRPLSL